MRYSFYMITMVSIFFIAISCMVEKLSDSVEKNVVKKLFSDTANCLVIDLEK